MINDALYSSKEIEWETPQMFFNKLNEEFHFTLDPCATTQNAKCAKYFTKDIDGLSQSWKDERVYCNPPYGKEISKWIEKAFYETNNGGGIVVMLLPARTDTKYFHDYIYGKAELRFIRGRLKFGNAKNSAPFPSMVVIFRGDKNETGKN